MSHRIKAKRARAGKVGARRDDPPAPAWPSYEGTSRFVGVSPSGRVSVFVDPSLGPPGLQNAQDLLNDADRVVTANDSIFGTSGGRVSVIVFALGGATDGTGGAVPAASSKIAASVAPTPQVKADAASKDHASRRRPSDRLAARPQLRAATIANSAGDASSTNSAVNSPPI